MQIHDNFPKAIWFNGLSGAGKTTLSHSLGTVLVDHGFKVKIFDGDDLRNGLNRDLGFTLTDRHENIRRAAEITNMFLNEGYIVINAFITPTKLSRTMARQIIGKQRLIEVYLSTPVEVCRIRDLKGLYRLSDSGIINDLTGVSSVFEPCDDAELILDTSELNVSKCTSIIEELFLSEYKLNTNFI